MADQEGHSPVGVSGNVIIIKKRNAVGKDARFKYSGFDVEPE
jgi:hypothetical protein